VFILDVVLAGSEGSEPAPFVVGEDWKVEMDCDDEEDGGGKRGGGKRGGGSGGGGVEYAAWVPANPFCSGGLSVSNMGADNYEGKLGSGFNILGKSIRIGR